MTAAAKKPRLSKEDKAIAEAERLAKLLAEAPPLAAGQLTPPAFIADVRLAAAQAVWRALAPELERTGRLQQLDRLTFAALCYWQSEWIAAVDDIARRGYSFMAQAVAGGQRPWLNPSVGRRDRAFDQIMALSAKFGLTPLDRVALVRARRAGHADDEDELPLPMPQTQAAAEPAAEADPWEKLIH